MKVHIALTALVLVAAACSEPRTPTDPALVATPSFGKGAGGGGGGGGGSGSGAGQKILFINGVAAARRIMTVNPDGSGLDTIRVQGEYNTPVWSPDRSMIAYTVGDGGYPPIYTMRANGSHVTQIGNGMNPRWSPNGSKIAYHRFANVGGGSSQADVYVMNANGTDVIRLTVDGAFDGFPTWSPDGNRIAFMSHRTGVDEIFVMNADGTGQTKLTACANLAANCRNPQWSPVAGDQRILYSFYGPGLTWRTISANGAGGGTVLPGLPATGVSWSPDATKLAISYAAPGLVYQNIYTVNPDGTALTRLTFETQHSETVPSWTR